MATRIRTEENIRGFEIRLNGTIHSLTISQLADDTTLFLKSKNEISIALNIIEIFGNLSGLKLNRNKTEGIWLGRLKHCKEKFEDISWTNEIVKCLGVYFGHNKAKCQQANIEKQIQKSENIINSWNKRNLSLLGKITVVKSLILPNITFIASVCTIPPEYIQKFKSIIYNFIWGGKTDRIKRSDLCKNYTEGGLKMIDIDQYLNSIKISWIKRLTTSTLSSWMVIPLFYFENFGPELLIFKMNLDNLKSLGIQTFISTFYIDLIKTWIKCRDTEPEPIKYSDIRKQMLWGNQYIKHNGKCLLMKNWINSGIYFINDILDEKGNISESIILQKLVSKQNWISEFSIVKKSVPSVWKQEVRSQNSVKTKVNIKIYDKKITLKSINIKELTSKQIYHILIQNKNTDKPLGFNIWMKKINIEFYSDIEKMLEFVFCKLKDNKFKMYKWKLLHNILPCKTLLFKWHIATDNKCNFCNVIEDYQHLFFDCQRLTTFWAKVIDILHKLKLGSHILTLKNIVIGYKIREGYESLNYLLVLIGFSIYKGYLLSKDGKEKCDIFNILKKEIAFAMLYEKGNHMNVLLSKFLDCM